MFEITAHPLPSDFKGTPQQLLAAWLERIVITADDVAMISSDVMPTGNQGPWFKNGNQLWVWNGTEYAPMSVSNVVPPEVFIGDTAPDPDTYPLWFRITDANAPVGLYTFLDGAWETQDLGLQNGAITEIKIADLAVTAVKIASSAVTPSKISNGLSLDLWTPAGSPNDFMRTVAGAPTWQSDRVVFADLDIVPGTLHTFHHGLGSIPFRVEIYFVAKTDFDFSTGFIDLLEGDAAHITSVVGLATQPIVITAAKVEIPIPMGASVKLEHGYVIPGSPATPAEDFRLRVIVIPQ